MKKIISLVLAFSLITASMVCVSAQPGDFPQEPAEELVYAADFSKPLPTEENDITPYWTLDQSGGSVNTANGQFVMERTANEGTTKASLNLPQPAEPSAGKEIVVVDTRFQSSGTMPTTNFLFLYDASDPEHERLAVSNNIYQKNFLYTTNDSAIHLIEPVSDTAWYDIQYYIDIAAETYDVVVDGKRVKTGLPYRGSGIKRITRLYFDKSGGNLGKLLLDRLNVSTMSRAAYEAMFSYGEIYYEEGFDKPLNTTDKTRPYWSVNEAGGSIAAENGIFTLSRTENVGTTEAKLIFPNLLPKPETGKKLVVESKLRFSTTSAANHFYAYMKENAAGGESAPLKGIIYNGNAIVNNDGAAVYIKPINPGQWYQVKYIYDPSNGTWDILTDGKCMVRGAWDNSAAGVKDKALALSSLLFQKAAANLGDISLDDLKIYSTGGAVRLGFGEHELNSGFYSSTITKTNGKIELVEEDGNKCLLVEQTSSAAETTRLDLNIPPVYAAAGHPYIVLEGRYKNTGGQNTELTMISGNAKGSSVLTNFRSYNNFLYVTDNNNTTTKVQEPYSADKWYFVQFIINTSDPAKVTFDVFVNGVKKQSNVTARIPSTDCINMLTFLKSSAGPSKLFVDQMNVYNATEAIISDIEISGGVSYAPGNNGVLSAAVKDNTGANVEKTVSFSLKEAYEGVSVSENGEITVDAAAKPGVFTVLAQAEANGSVFTKETAVRVTSDTEPFRLLSSNVNTQAASFRLASLSAQEHGLWVWVAVYAPDKTLKAVLPCTPAFDNFIWNANVSLAGAASPDDTVKVFFWENTDTMKPYFAASGNETLS